MRFQLRRSAWLRTLGALGLPILVTVLMSLLITAACAPAILKKVDKQAAEFEKVHPDAFRNYSVDGRRVRYAQNGDPRRPRAVFVHGTPGDWEAFAGFLGDERLLKDLYLISPDRPGFGGSDEGFAVASLKRQAALLAPLLGTESDPPAIVIGHSYGGPVAVQLAADYPKRVKGLVLIAASVDPSLEKHEFLQNFAEWRLTRWLVPSELRVCDDEIVALKGDLEALKPRLSSIHMPVIVIHGDRDDLVPFENAAFISREMSSADVRVNKISGENHFVLWTQPELVEDAILKIEASSASASGARGIDADRKTALQSSDRAAGLATGLATGKQDSF